MHIVWCYTNPNANEYYDTDTYAHVDPGHTDAERKPDTDTPTAARF